MAKRWLIAVVLVLAVLLSPLRLPAQSCALSMRPVQKMSCGDCCAKMKSCMLPRKDQTPPATAPAATQQSIALIASAVQTLLVQVPVASVKRVTRSLAIAPELPPRLAVLCTFLI